MLIQEQVDTYYTILYDRVRQTDRQTEKRDTQGKKTGGRGGRARKRWETD